MAFSIPSIRVYPRGCGGTEGGRSRRHQSEGLSPRVRGNLPTPEAAPALPGSIPAGAGEPTWPGSGLAPHRVYPRGCGGTQGVPFDYVDRVGLSPRVRGNHVIVVAGELDGGSIPAGAGEPRRTARSRRRIWVYPRGCGGTGRRGRGRVPESGLSPRVRGNPRRRPAGQEPSGSIPAGAGEPARECRCGASARVYPRGCGGTRLASGTVASVPGLSPRVRGNHPHVRAARSVERSIPAGAGEPLRGFRSNPPSRVYPRGCGGTHVSSDVRIVSMGLSPRVRGNRPGANVRRPNQGSIPAGAGEPPHRFA